MPPHPTPPTTDAEPCREPEAQQSGPELTASASAGEDLDGIEVLKTDVERAESEDAEKPIPTDGVSEESPETEAETENAALLKGWRISKYEPSLCELNGSVRMPGADSAW